MRPGYFQVELCLTYSNTVFYPTNLTIPSFSWFSFLRSAGGKIFRFPGLRQYRAWAKSAQSILHPPEYVVGHHQPSMQGTSPQKEITILSANLWHDWPHHRHLASRLEAFAKMVENNHVDILLLQEAARIPGLRSDEWLAERLGMSYVYVRANGDWKAIGFEEGLAIFSRYPLSDPLTSQLGENKNLFSRRLALSAQVETPSGTLQAVSAHLGILPKRNARQINHLQRWVRETAINHPAVVGGDFNAHETTDRITQLRNDWMDIFRKRHPQRDGFTHELRTPWGKLLRRSRLDYLFLKPGNDNWQVTDADHIKPPDRSHSDHCAVLARLKPAVLK